MAEYQVEGVEVSPIREGRLKGGAKVIVISDGKPFDLNFDRRTWDQLDRAVRAALREG
jgi:hypothetical protein